MLDEAPNFDHDDPASRAARTAPARRTRARRIHGLSPTPTSTEMPSKSFKKVTVHHRELHASTAQPHPEMKGRTKRSFNCQRAVARREALIHESVEELPERLHAQQLAGDRRIEGAEAGSIMRSRLGHLDAATNDNRDEIIPSSA